MALTELTRDADTLTITLQLLMIGIWYLRIPVLPRDLMDWVSTGRVPYLTAYDLMPSSMSYYRALKPNGVPLPPVLLRDSLEFLVDLKLEAPLPPANAIPLMARMATLLEIPPEIEHAAMRLFYINPRFNGTFETFNNPYENIMAHIVIALKLLYRYDDTYALSPIALRFDGIKAKSLPEWLLERYRIERNRPIHYPWTREELDHLPRESLYDFVDFLKYVGTIRQKNADISSLQNMFDHRPQTLNTPLYNEYGELNSFAKHVISGAVPLDSVSRPFCPVFHKLPSEKDAKVNDEILEPMVDYDRGEATEDVEGFLQRELLSKNKDASAPTEASKKASDENISKEPGMEGIQRYKIPYRLYERAMDLPGDVTYEYLLRVCSRTIDCPYDRLRDAVFRTERLFFPDIIIKTSVPTEHHL